MKAGLLYASSMAHPSIGTDFLQTARQIIYQHASESSLPLFVESVGLGGQEKDVYEKSRTHAGGEGCAGADCFS